MNLRACLALSLALIALTPVIQASSSCPFARADSQSYTKVEILNNDGNPMGYKLVDEQFTIRAVKIELDKRETLLPGRKVDIYFMDGARKSLVSSGTTNNLGEYSYTPTKVGSYYIEVASRAITLPVHMRYDSPTDFGAVCGDGKCEPSKLENYDNCPEDCAVCGDGHCAEGWEDDPLSDHYCYQDCGRCGDGICDPTELTGLGKTNCPADCVVCGDGICSSEYGEDCDTCPEDCGEPESEEENELLTEYWWVIAVVCGLAGVVAVWMIKRRGDDTPRRRKLTKAKKDVEEKDEMVEIITELMDTGVPDRRIIGKLDEYGIKETEGWKLIKKARK
jgi:hypothetical protein